MRLIAVALIVLSTSAFACPDLRGQYSVCRSVTTNITSSYNFSLNQEEVDGVTVYTMAYTSAEDNQNYSETRKADGVVETTIQVDPTTNMSVQIDSVSSCSDNAFNTDYTVSFQEMAMAEIKTVVTKTGNALHIENTVNNMGEVSVDHIVCE